MPSSGSKPKLLWQMHTSKWNYKKRNNEDHFEQAPFDGESLLHSPQIVERRAAPRHRAFSAEAGRYTAQKAVDLAGAGSFFRTHRCGTWWHSPGVLLLLRHAQGSCQGPQ